MFKNKLFPILTLAIIAFSFLLTSCKEDSPVAQETDHFEADGMLIKLNGKEYMKILKGEYDTKLENSFNMIVGENTGTYSVTFLDSLGKDLGVPTESDHIFGWEIGDTSVVKLTPVDSNRWSFRLKAGKPLATTIELRILHVDHPDFKTPKIPVNVK